MITLKRKYKGIDDTLRHIRLQVLQSIPYAKKNCPNFSQPDQLYRWLKSLTTYKNDPNNVELLQTMPTMIEGKFWGIEGAGDCDCFTIATLACCEVLGWPSWIKLAGRDRIAPVHIWSGVTINGEDIALDLTQRLPGSERDYKYIQKINFIPIEKSLYSLSQTQRMYLQLAENNLSDQCGLPPIHPLRSRAKDPSGWAKYDAKKKAWDDCRTGKGKSTVNPIKAVVLAPGRAVFLIMLDYNIDGLASRLATEDITALTAQWNKLGGDSAKLVQMINNGKGKPAHRMGFLTKFTGGTALADDGTEENPGNLTNDQKVKIIAASTALGTAIGATFPPTAPVAIPGGPILGTVLVGLIPFIKNAANKTPSSETAGANLPTIPPPPDSTLPDGSPGATSPWLSQTNSITGYSNSVTLIAGTVIVGSGASAYLLTRKNPRQRKAGKIVAGATVVSVLGILLIEQFQST